MTYIIKREFDTPFDQAFTQVILGNNIYDVVKSHKNSGLEVISDFIIDDNNVLIKSDIATEHMMKTKIESTLNIKLQELLLG